MTIIPSDPKPAWIPDPAAKIELGHIMVSFRARDLKLDLEPYLRRHERGDWGEITDTERLENDLACANGWRIESQYDTPKVRIAIVTQPRPTRMTLVSLQAEL